MLICFYSHDYFVLFEANYIFDKVSHDNWEIFVIFLAALKQYLPNSDPSEPGLYITVITNDKY